MSPAGPAAVPIAGAEGQAPATAWHALAPEQARERLESGPEGLSEEEAARRLRRDGPNRLPPPPTRSAARRLFEQLAQPLVVVLIVAAAASAALGELVDAFVIGAVVLINALVGYLQEARAEGAIAALDALVVAQATVVRGGAPRRVAGEELVRGDLVALQAGDAVPADLRLVQVRDLHAAEAALTGESVPVRKQVDALPEATALADRRCLAYAGTVVTYGVAQGVVVAVGGATETGRIAGLIAGAEGLVTPLTRRLAALSRVILWVILAASAAMMALEVARGGGLAETFAAAVAFAVGAIPEGLPAAVTVVLAVGVSHMARRGAIVRRLPAVETLGSTTVVCTDKTGTLTENQMTVTRVWSLEGELEVTGGGYEPRGELLAGGAAVDLAARPVLRELIRCGAVCQDTRLRRQGGRTAVEGDPTEAALIVLGEKAGLDPAAAPARLDALPFASEHMYMATLHADAEGPLLYVKGSSDVLLPRCVDGLGGALDRPRVQEEVRRMAGDGLRVLCLARRRLEPGRTAVDHEDVEALSLLGLVGMIDPPRAAARHAIETCQRAGVVVKMITGDHVVTAAAIARQLGLTGERDPAGRLVALSGAELSALQPDELARRARSVAVFARVAPEQKLALVRALQAQGEVVAMTGDGVNDAPALEQADIGVAMGQGGTDVARGAAAMVLTDDDFATIEAAVEEGRAVFDNLVKFVAWTLPTNGGEGLVILAAVVLGTTLPILPVQILWMNLAAAVLLGTTLVFEPKEPGIMARPPRPVSAPFLDRALLLRTALVSGLIALTGFGLFEWCLRQGGSAAVARTVASNTVVVVQVGYLFACRSLSLPTWRIGLFTNPWVWGGALVMLVLQLAWTYLPVMNRLFHTAPLPWTWWVYFTGAGGLVYALVEVTKLLGRGPGRAERG